MAKIKDATVLQDEVPQTREWFAWFDLVPWHPHAIHVLGEVFVPNAGVKPLLTYREPQGHNPLTLWLDLALIQEAGDWPDAYVWRGVVYDAVMKTVPTRVVIFIGDEVVTAMDVDPIGLAGQDPSAGVLKAGGAVPSPRKAWSGENPFPWARRDQPLCVSGGLSTISVDTCMDGARYLLMHGDARIRVKGATDAVSEQLDGFADKRIIITVCGEFRWSVEGCQYLLATHVEPMTDFARRVSVAQS